jgi:hypothetical protein
VKNAQRQPDSRPHQIVVRQRWVRSGRYEVVPGERRPAHCRVCLAQQVVLQSDPPTAAQRVAHPPGFGQAVDRLGEPARAQMEPAQPLCDGCAEIRVVRRLGQLDRTDHQTLGMFAIATLDERARQLSLHPGLGIISLAAPGGLSSHGEDLDRLVEVVVIVVGRPKGLAESPHHFVPAALIGSADGGDDVGPLGFEPVKCLSPRLEARTGAPRRRSGRQTQSAGDQSPVQVLAGAKVVVDGSLHDGISLLVGQVVERGGAGVLVQKLVRAERPQLAFKPWLAGSRRLA